jgi:aminoglycoside/choline kinase family phosphotransferase
MSDYTNGQKARALYKEIFGAEPEVTPLQGAGSDRRYYRLSAPGKVAVVATEGTDLKENNCFVALSEAFRSAGVPTPAIYGVSETGDCYLQEDLGDAQLLPLLSGENRTSLAEAALRGLAHLQTVEREAWEDKVMAPEFSHRQVMWDLNYFKYSFLKRVGAPFDEDRLEDDFEKLAGVLCNAEGEPWGFMYRDFQSRNVMIKDGEPRWIDFQGGRCGPLVYDAVSFMWQAKAGFSMAEREHLADVYAGELASILGVGRDVILERTGIWALFRTLQVLGAYGFRGLIERRAHFIESIPAALENLSELLRKGVLDGYAELKRVAGHLIESAYAGRPEKEGLTVQVFSFSYKRGYPEDLSGNGGGFMFDCRGMHNPGRYEAYKPLTGRDRQVIDFLEERGEVQVFVNRALEIVAPSVERYNERGFSRLQVGFGCTGGRHRSVYCAQHLAEALAARYPGIRVELIHREQGIREIMNDK